MLGLTEADYSGRSPGIGDVGILKILPWKSGQCFF
jgi:hypothetical protein